MAVLVARRAVLDGAPIRTFHRLLRQSGEGVRAEVVAPFVFHQFCAPPFDGAQRARARRRESGMKGALCGVWAVAIACAHGGGEPIGGRPAEENARCVVAINANNLDDAEIACGHGLEFAPDDPDLVSNRGLIFRLRGDDAHAKEWFIRAIRLNQENAQAYTNLGAIYLGEGDAKQAKTQFARALKVNPDYAEALWDLHLAQRKLGETADAEKTLRTLIHVHESIADPHAALGGLLLERGDAEHAEAEFARAAELDPKTPGAYLYLGLSRLKLGRADAAREAFELCPDATPADREQCQQQLDALSPAGR